MKSNRLVRMLFVPIMLLLAGCAVHGTAPRLAIPASLLKDSETAAQQVQDCHLRVGLEFTNTLLEDKQVLEIWYARPDKMRLEILQSSHPGFQDIIAASEGTLGWMYQHHNNRVDAGPIETVKPAIVFDLVRSALELLWESRSIQVDDIAVDYVNREWVFRLSSRTEQVTCTLWLNTASLLPVRLHYRDPKLGQYTMTISEAEYNLGLTAELFDLTLLPTNDYTVRSFD